MDPQSVPLLELEKRRNKSVSPYIYLFSACKSQQKALLKLIKDLQERHKVFAVEDYPNEERIFNVMNIILKKVVRETLDKIAVVDNVFAEMICYAFFGLLESENKPPESESDKWSEMKLLYFLLVAAFVSNSMHHIYGDKEEFATNHEYFETRALNLFNEMYLENREKLEYHVLAFDCEEVFRKPYRELYISDDGTIIDIRKIKDSKKKKDEWQKPSRELLCVAYRGKCMKFIAHPACQNYIKTRWEEGKVKKLFDPAWPSKEVEKANEGSSRFSAKLSLIFWPPRSKYVLHLIFKVIYLILFGFVLIDKPWRRIVTSQGEIDWNLRSVMFCYVVLNLISENMSQVYKIYYLIFRDFRKNKRYRKYQSAFWWSHPAIPFVRSLFGIAGVAALLLALIGSWRSYMVPLSEIIFTICFVISAATTLNFFSFSDYFGPKLKLIQKMAYSIVKYMIILSAFWIIYAVCYLSLSEGGSNQGSIVWKMFQAGAFEIFGELRDEDRVGQFDSCSEILSGNHTQLEKLRCTFQSTLIPPLTFLYMMTATIMLINIFTAMLSHEYESTSEKAANYSKFCKYGMLARFESKKLFPRPFHLFFYFGWLVYYGIKNCRSNFCISPCCVDLSQLGPLRYVSNWFTSSRKWGSSPTDARVNKKKVEDLIKKVMAQRTSHDFLEEVLKYANKKKTERGNNAAGGIPEAQKILEEIISQFTKYLSAETAKKTAELRDCSTSIATFVDDRSRNPSGRDRSNTTII